MLVICDSLELPSVEARGLSGAEDLEELRQADFGPVLGDLVLADAIEQDAGQCCGPAARWHAHEVSRLAAAESPAARDDVTLRDLVAHFHVDVLERSPQCLLVRQPTLAVQFAPGRRTYDDVVGHIGLPGLVEVATTVARPELSDDLLGVHG